MSKLRKAQSVPVLTDTAGRTLPTEKYKIELKEALTYTEPNTGVNFVKGQPQFTNDEEFAEVARMSGALTVKEMPGYSKRPEVKEEEQDAQPASGPTDFTKAGSKDK